MLEFIITSKTKRDILVLLFINPDREFYIRDISRKVRQQPNLVRAELKKLEKGDLIKSRRIGNTICYSANKGSFIYSEVKGLVTKLGGFADILANALSSYKDKINFAFVYGSYARGEEKSASDIDLLIIGEPQLETFNRTIKGIEKTLCREINYSVYPKKEFIRKADSGFLSRILQSKKIMLIGDEHELKRLAE